MDTIVLTSSSGKWKYTATHNNPLFAPMFEDMLSEGMKLPSELVIQGALGEELEKGWKYISIIEEWMKWDKECSRIMIPSDYDIQNWGKTLELWKFEYYPISPPKSPVVHFHDIQVLSRVLALPVGWEAYVIIDEKDKLEDRIEHIKRSINYLQNNKDILLSTVIYLERDIYNMIYSSIEWEDILLIPFLRNLWLNRVNSDKIPNKIDTLEFLALLDWEALVVIVTRREEDNYTDALIPVGRAIMGESVSDGDMGRETCIVLSRTSNGIELRDNSIIPQYQYLYELYSRILHNLPLDIDISSLGLDAILGRKTTKILKTIHRLNYDYNGRDETHVPVNRLVGWINACVITYIGWYKSNNRTLLPKERDGSNLVLNLQDIVTLLGKSLGLYSMRRMLLSLLYFIEKGGKKTEIEKADIFANMLEEYLDQREGEYEGVNTLLLSDTGVIK